MSRITEVHCELCEAIDRNEGESMPRGWGYVRLMYNHWDQPHFLLCPACYELSASKNTFRKIWKRLFGSKP